MKGFFKHLVIHNFTCNGSAESGGSSGGGESVEPVLQELSITENGEYLPSEGVDGFYKVMANIYIPTTDDMMATLPKWTGGSY